VDMNIEHMMSKIKAKQELFAAKGVYGGWDCLANISAAIHVLDSIQTRATRMWIHRILFGGSPEGQ
ncbi:hypothetical protein B0H10DRAFT_1815677, partial [Mycena sp. CBHHK59/15]